MASSVRCGAERSYAGALAGPSPEKHLQFDTDAAKFRAPRDGILDERVVLVARKLPREDEVRRFDGIGVIGFEEVGDRAMVELRELREFEGRERTSSGLDVDDCGSCDPNRLRGGFLGETAIGPGLLKSSPDGDLVDAHSSPHLSVLAVVRGGHSSDPHAECGWIRETTNPPDN